uniref:Fatty-acid and retinol-binding protein 1 n=1 Tax=Bursaphelenchus xylophilus TaxID=6326 RepID=A0A1I7SCW1_BURXY
MKFLVVAVCLLSYVAGLSQTLMLGPNHMDLDDIEQIKVFNNLKRISDDAGVRFTYESIKRVFDDLFEKANKVVEPGTNYPSSYPVEELQVELIDHPEINPRGPDYNKVLAKVEEVHGFLAAVLSELDRAPYDAVRDVARLLAKNEVTDTIRRNAQRFGETFDDIVHEVISIYLKGERKGLNLFNHVQKLLGIISKPEANKLIYEKELQNIDAVIKNASNVSKKH